MTSRIADVLGLVRHAAMLSERGEHEGSRAAMADAEARLIAMSYDAEIYAGREVLSLYRARVSLAAASSTVEPNVRCAYLAVARAACDELTRNLSELRIVLEGAEKELVRVNG